MAVYVDDALIPMGRMLMSHMIADNLDELHEMANRLGVRRWFQSPPKTSFPHYDICKSNREKAIELGAIPLTRKNMARKTMAMKREAYQKLNPTNKER